MQRAEHNDGCLTTLQEISLHQLNIEKIDLLGHACRGLKILYLQNNLISKLENLHHLKVAYRLNAGALAYMSASDVQPADPHNLSLAS